ncbi:MAG: cation efflux protein, CzcI family [Pseudomonadota bacterium]
MRKLILILLLAVLPLQYAWAAAAVYCAHETGTSKHFGHHAHQHQGGDRQDEPQTPAKAKVHADCAVCQFSLQASLPAALTLPAAAERTVYPPHPPPLYSSHIADGPKRPDWGLAA